MGEVGGGEQLCLLPAHEELSQLNYTANSSGVQSAHICHTGLQCSDFGDPFCS